MCLIIISFHTQRNSKQSSYGCTMPQVSGYNVQWCGTHTRFDDHDPTYSPGSPPGSPLSREVEPEPECAVCFQAIGNTNCYTRLVAWNLLGMFDQAL